MDSLGRRPFILIADDNQDLAKGLSLLLKIDGFEVEAVHDGREALRAARPAGPMSPPGYRAPGLDGFQVAEQMRNDPGLADVLIIAISGYARDMFQGRSRRVGFDHHLVKPANPQAILSLIGRSR